MGLSLLVFVFAILTGQVMGYVQKILGEYNIPLAELLLYLPLLIPYVLMFALPMSVMTGMLLVFGKFSADNELTTLRASGLSLGRLVWPAFAMAILATMVCVYINTVLGPWCKDRFKERIIAVLSRTPRNFLTPNKTAQFGDLRVLAERINGNVAENIYVEWLGPNGHVDKSIRAQRGTLTFDPQTLKIHADLENVRVEARDPHDPSNPSKIRPGMTAATFPLELDAKQFLSQSVINKGEKDLTLAELLDAISQENANLAAAEKSNRAKLKKRIATLSIEVQRRFSWAVACVVFALLAVPLGIRTHRGETSINAALALLLIGLYYFLTALSSEWKGVSLAAASAWLWLPNYLFGTVGAVMLWRVSKK